MKDKLISLVIAIFLMSQTNISKAQNYDNSTIITFIDSGQNLGVGRSFSIILGNIKFTN